MTKAQNNLLPSEQKNNGAMALKKLLATPLIKKQLQAALKDNTKTFMLSLVNLAESNNLLTQCDPESVYNSAIVSVLLNLPINNNFGYAYIVPYKDNRTGTYIAQFQMGYKGLIQLALRTGDYKHLNATDIREGELTDFNLLTGEYEFNFEKNIEKRKKLKVIGYASYLELHNGFRNILYMTVEELEEHAATYSASYKYDLAKKYRRSLWSTNFPVMSLKTVLKLNISKYGTLTPDLQKAMISDGAKIKDVTVDDDGILSFDVTYIDNKGATTQVVSELTEKVTNDERLELLKNAELVKFDIVKYGKSLNIDIEDMSKDQLDTLQFKIDELVNEKMEVENL